MMQAPKILESRSGGAWGRVAVICVMALVALGWAQESNIKDVSLVTPPKVKKLTEHERIVKRNALIQSAVSSHASTRSGVKVLRKQIPPHSRVYSNSFNQLHHTVNAERAARLGTYEEPSSMTLRRGLEELGEINKARRERFEDSPEGKALDARKKNSYYKKIRRHNCRHHHRRPRRKK